MNMHLLSLPDCMLEEVLQYLTYDEVAKIRVVCVQLNKICQSLLNRGFTKMVRRHTLNLKKIKSQLPRRESERKNHPLAKHADILTCIETRISMLSMTYTKYIDLNLCCFIPGKVIDEVFNILRLVDTTSKPLRAHEVLQELRDISSMAIDHFDEKIAHILKKSYDDLSKEKFGSTIFQIMQSPSEMSLVMQSDFGSDTSDSRQLTEDLRRFHDENNTRMALRKMERKYKDAMKKLQRVMGLQNKQQRQLRNTSMQISELNSQIVDLRRRLEESDTKNREITSNINQITTLDTGASSSSSPIKSRNIKPRAATIILKRRIAECSSPTKKPKIDFVESFSK